MPGSHRETHKLTNLVTHTKLLVDMNLKEDSSVDRKKERETDQPRELLVNRKPELHHN